MKLSRQFTVFGSAVFCVVIFSLYLMLDRGHFDHPKSPRREGTFPKVSGQQAGRGGRIAPGMPGRRSGSGQRRCRWALSLRGSLSAGGAAGRLAPFGPTGAAAERCHLWAALLPVRRCRGRAGGAHPPGERAARRGGWR